MTIQFDVIGTEILDFAVADEEGNVRPSEISVAVTVEVKGSRYCLDFQTTTTHDYGAYSSKLESYDENDDHCSLEKVVGDDDAFADLLEAIKSEANPESEWRDYVSENYSVSDDDFGGMDANSEVNQAKVK